MDLHIRKFCSNKNNLTERMLMLNLILSACIVQAVHACSLYVYTTIPMGGSVYYYTRFIQQSQVQIPTRAIFHIVLITKNRNVWHSALSFPMF